MRKTEYLNNLDKNKPLISIVTVVFNGEQFLEKTICSVVNQTYRNIEYIIIDGGSLDRTLDIIKKYDDKIYCWISEQDEGIYDAMNKAIKLYSGDYIWFLNAGDTIYNDDVIANMFNVLTNADIYYGATQLVDIANNDKKLVKAPEILDFDSLGKGMIVSHQSVVLKRSCVLPYSLTYKYVSDYEWLIKVSKRANSIQNTKIIMSKYLLDGFSQNNFLGCWRDRLIIVEEYYGKSILIMNYGLFVKDIAKKTLKIFLQFVGFLEK